MTMPPADMPDNYHGNHSASRIRWVSIESHHTTATGHLLPGGMNGNKGTTYCTRYNPVWLIDLHGLKYTSPNGIQVVTGGVALPELLHGLTRVAFQGAAVVWCEHCLTMLAVEAEMIGQRDYPVKRLLSAMDRQQTAN